MTMLELGACFCGQPATRTLAAVPYCDPCAETVLGRARLHDLRGDMGRPHRRTLLDLRCPDRRTTTPEARHHPRLRRRVQRQRFTY
jgi:hypothetical protein